jgi:hypothetical protein
MGIMPAEGLCYELAEKMNELIQRKASAGKGGGSLFFGRLNYRGFRVRVHRTPNKGARSAHLAHSLKNKEQEKGLDCTASTISMGATFQCC